MANENHGKGPEEVPITIDRKPHKVTNPVKGSDLYALGGIASDYELYVESRGDEDDQLIENSDKTYKMEPGDKLYSSPKSLNPGS
jgi:hypothetical protein